MLNVFYFLKFKTAQDEKSILRIGSMVKENLTCIPVLVKVSP